MSTTALGIAPDSDGNGVTPLTHRKVQQYQWASPGVCGGLEVSGGTDLNYTVSEGMAVTTRGDSDGYSLAYYEGGTVETDAGDSSNPRYDVVWLSAHDISQGDDDNLVTLGVTVGSPAASPSVPDVDSDCTVVDTLLVPAGMTATSSCTSTGEVDYAVPYGANLGLLGYKKQTTSSTMSSSWVKSSTVTFYVPTDRWVECVFECRVNVEPNDSWSYPHTTYNSSCYYQLYIDGEATDSSSNDRFFMCSHTLHQRVVEPAIVTKGTHTAYFMTKPYAMSYADPHWRGLRNTYVYDRGVADE